MNNTTRFDGKGELYAKSRPKYAEMLFADIKKALKTDNDSVFADIGSGTGIFTEQLLKEGYRVYAVEPNADMRKKAEQKLCVYGKFHSVDGADSDTRLPEHSVDLITTAQAFHWFDAEKFKKECERILKPDGKVIIAYNSRDTEAECTKALACLRRKYNPEFHGFSNGISDKACRDFYNGRCDVLKYENNLVYDRQGYINRVLSSSYSLKENDVKYHEYLEDINKLFERYEVNGIITVPNFTVAYLG